MTLLEFIIVIRAIRLVDIKTRICFNFDLSNLFIIHLEMFHSDCQDFYDKISIYAAPLPVLIPSYIFCCLLLLVYII